MRVISGTIKGRRLQTVSGCAVRPTSDRVKESMFNILADRCRDAKVLDLYAGSGALGIEAISRGAGSVVFIDSSKHALTVLRQNLKHCNIEKQARVIRHNIERNLNCLEESGLSFDMIFMDPPYRRNLVAKTLRHLMRCDVLANHGIIIAEHEPRCPIDLSGICLTLIDTRRYGSTQLSFFTESHGIAAP